MVGEMYCKYPIVVKFILVVAALNATSGTIVTMLEAIIKSESLFSPKWLCE